MLGDGLPVDAIFASELIGRDAAPVLLYQLGAFGLFQVLDHAVVASIDPDLR
jgi:hypothetical protein